MMNLDNCPRCGKLFSKNFRDVCPACIKEIDKEYELCSDYLRKNKGTNINDLSNETGVSVRQITKFVREGRISIVNAPNMAYPCEVCGTLIRENNMCDSCRARLISDTGKMRNEDTRRAEEQEAQKANQNIYKGLDRYKDR